MYKVLDTVALTHDVPAAKLRRGDLGAIVEILASDALEVEFVGASGKTQALLTLHPDDVRPVGNRDLIAVRSLEGTDGYPLAHPDRSPAALARRPLAAG